MNKLTYSEKLRDPRWQKKRLRVFERDEFKCCKCGDHTTTLNVHHLRYNGNPWDAPMAELETLCEDCHTVIELLKKEQVSGIKLIKCFVDAPVDDFPFDRAILASFIHEGETDRVATIFYFNADGISENTHRMGAFTIKVLNQLIS